MKSNIKIFSTIIYFFITLFSYSQKEGNYWFFGQLAGIEFSSGSPVAVTGGGLITYEGCATISDAKGNLLFYTDGINVWNKKHKVMPNGEKLHGGIASTQSSIIVKKPLSETIYYIFTVDENGGPYGLQYSIVDMSQNSGLGDIIEKNIMIYTPVSEKITAIKHANNIDIWIITHAWNSDEFCAYLVTSNGVRSVPVISKIGTMHDGLIFNTGGYMKASPDGSKIALAIQGKSLIEIFDFNAETGILSNCLSIGNYEDVYGIEFSPDIHYLYVSQINHRKIWQFDMFANNAAMLKQSGKIIANTSCPIGALQLASDGKIYVARDYESYLGVINHPEQEGVACNYIEKAVSLNGYVSRLGLPTFNQSYFKLFYYENTCYGDTTIFTLPHIATIDSVKWNFGDTISGMANYSTDIKPTHVFSSAGDFKVTLFYYINGIADSIKQIVKIISLPKANFSLSPMFCANDTVEIHYPNQASQVSYNWNFGGATIISGENQGTYKAIINSETTIITLQIYDGACYSSIYSDTIKAPKPIECSIETSANKCNGYCKGTAEAKVTGGISPLYFTWYPLGTAFKTDSIATELCAGTYSVQITDSRGCNSLLKTFNITEPQTPFYTAEVTPPSCHNYKNAAIQINVPNKTATYSFLWSDGTTNSFLKNIPNGNYMVSIIDSSKCVKTLSIDVPNPPAIIVQVTDNTDICLGQTVNLSASIKTGGVSPFKYFWNNSQTTSSISVSPKSNTTYKVFITDKNNCYSDTASVKVSIFAPIKLKIKLSNDTIYCPGEPVTITADVTGGSKGPYTFSFTNGKIISMPYELTPQTTTTYSIKVTDNCNSPAAIDTFRIVVFEKPYIKIKSNRISGCYPLTVEFSAETPESTNFYSWNFGDGNQTIKSKSSTHTYTVPGKYDVQVSVTTSHGCSNTLKKAGYITVYSRPEADFIANPDVVTIINPMVAFNNLSSGAIKNYWNFGDGETSVSENPYHVYTKNGIFNVKLVVENIFGCTDTTSANIMVKDQYTFYMPTGFTPDNNGINETFQPTAIGIASDNYLMVIYDRWGQKIFETTKLNEGWDGTIKNGQKAEVGVYSWVVIYKDLSGADHQQIGSVTLIR